MLQLEETREILNPAIEQLRQLLVELELDNDSNDMDQNVIYILMQLLQLVYGPSTKYSNICGALKVLNIANILYQGSLLNVAGDDQSGIDEDRGLYLKEIIVEQQESEQ